MAKTIQPEKVNPPTLPPRTLNDVPIVPAFSIVRFGGYWHPVMMRIKGDKVVEKEVGNGDMLGIAILKGQLWLEKANGQ